MHWRLTHGEGPKDLKPKSVVVLIGTNDLNHVFDVSTFPAGNGVLHINKGQGIQGEDMAMHAPTTISGWCGSNPTDSA